MNPRIIDFRAPLVSETTEQPADRRISGQPRQTIANYLSDPSQQFHCGRWSSTRGKWRIQYTEWEFCCLTEGRVALEDPDGCRTEFGPGEGFVVPAGFKGTWEVLEDCTKFYVIFEPRT
jgi:uncharacterized cupin superfamily protein